MYIVIIQQNMSVCIGNDCIYTSFFRRVYKVLLGLLYSNRQVSELLKVVARGRDDRRLQKCMFCNGLYYYYDNTSSIFSAKVTGCES